MQVTKVVFHQWEKRSWRFVVGSLWALRWWVQFIHYEPFREKWEDVSKRLWKAKGLKMLDDKLWNSLQISFHSLELDEKDAFGCGLFLLFINDVHGWKGIIYTRALRTWEYLCYMPSIPFANLRDIFFLKVKFWGQMQMHDQVQDMCQNIACPYNWVANYTKNDGIRLWDPRKVMQCIKGIKNP